ncbi:MAG: hypothetical protein ACTSRU_08255 [Candidatus Hodarchaeales archaeon]
MRIDIIKQCISNIQDEFMTLRTHVQILEEELGFERELVPVRHPQEILEDLEDPNVPTLSTKPIQFRNGFHLNKPGEKTEILSHTFDRQKIDRQEIFYFNKNILEDYHYHPEVKADYRVPYIYGKMYDKRGQHIDGEMELFISRKVEGVREEGEEEGEGEGEKEDEGRKGFILKNISTILLNRVQVNKPTITFPARETLFAREGDELIVSLLSEQEIDPDNCKLTIEHVIFEEVPDEIGLKFEKTTNKCLRCNEDTDVDSVFTNGEIYCNLCLGEKVCDVCKKVANNIHLGNGIGRCNDCNKKDIDAIGKILPCDICGEMTMTMTTNRYLVKGKFVCPKCREKVSDEVRLAAIRSALPEISELNRTARESIGLKEEES